ncbi:MAG: hypothetical protein HOC05_20655, partial [Gemmatimonadetes bacterium]|nr:hypothetical protein [Gemmatimonadota bacterium]
MMLKITDWPTPPKAMWDVAGELHLALEDGLAVLRNHELAFLPEEGQSGRQLVSEFTEFPASLSGQPLEPLVADLFGNFWSLKTSPSGTDLF